jgi:sodium transport system ATP-binding protein
MIEVRNLQKHFGAVAAVDGVSFTAPSGAITGLLGPNGAGKTTSIRMLGALIDIGGGSINVDGIDVAQDAIGARRVCGILTDARGLYPRLTARENVRYYAELRGVPTARSEATLQRLVEWLDMGGIIDRRTEGFSQGERMKVAIARALIHEPANVVLDEPTNGLDVMTTRALRQLIQRLKAEGRTVMFSSHIMQEVAALCDEIIIIAKGKVTAQGSAAALLEQSGKANLEDAFVSLAGIEDHAHAAGDSVNQKAA